MALIASSAADCEIKYTRTACAGKEAESFKKCDGKQSCTKSDPAASADACKVAAAKACANDRLDVTKSKTINASFKGAALTSSSGSSDFCSDYANKAVEFNHCPEDKK